MIHARLAKWLRRVWADRSIAPIICGTTALLAIDAMLLKLFGVIDFPDWIPVVVLLVNAHILALAAFWPRKRLAA